MGTTIEDRVSQLEDQVAELGERVRHMGVSIDQFRANLAAAAGALTADGPPPRPGTRREQRHAPRE